LAKESMARNTALVAPFPSSLTIWYFPTFCIVPGLAPMTDRDATGEFTIVQ
jgi:hypothetical protein